MGRNNLAAIARAASVTAALCTARRLQVHLNNMPANKMQFRTWAGFLKDSSSLASYNIGPGDVVELSMKTRGGKR